jgi:hypothetical protein
VVAGRGEQLKEVAEPDLAVTVFVEARKQLLRHL